MLTMFLTQIIKLRLVLISKSKNLKSLAFPLLYKCGTLLDQKDFRKYYKFWNTFENIFYVIYEFEKFIQCIASSYYRGANAVMICYDYSKIQTLNTTRKWLDNAIAENPTQEVFEI